MTKGHRALRASRPRRTSLVSLMACALALPAGFACGDSEAESRAAARAQAAREFGRRDDGARDPSTPSSTGEAGSPSLGSSSAGTSPAAGAPPTDASPAPASGVSERAADPTTTVTDRSVARGARPRDTEGTAPAAPLPAAPPSPDVLPDPGRPRVDPSASTIDVDSLLAAAEAAYASLRSLRAAFVQRMEVPLLDRTSTGRGVWYQRGRDLFRMDFTDPPDDVFVADGTYLWLYQPSVQPDQVIRSDLAEGAIETGTADLLGRILAEARTGYDAVYEGRADVEGVPTHAVTLTPRGPSGYLRVRVWIAVADRLVRRFEIVEENESVRTVTLSRLEPGAALADTLFRFTPPPGVSVFNR